MTRASRFTYKEEDWVLPTWGPLGSLDDAEWFASLEHVDAEQAQRFGQPQPKSGTEFSSLFWAAGAHHITMGLVAVPNACSRCYSYSGVMSTTARSAVYGFCATLVSGAQGPYGRALSEWWVEVGRRLVGPTKLPVFSRLLPAHRAPALPAPSVAERVWQAFADLQDVFQDLDQRLVKCAHLESALGEYERSLQSTGAEELRWCVGLLRDVLSYNYAEQLSKEALQALGAAMELIRTRGPALTRDDYRAVRDRFVSLGLAIVPTSRKAVAEYGDAD